uniref:thioredoxin-dependent peroxiredoxin n=1 Tax=Macaca fascicularis TaxID=9541 RepID=A0A805Q6Y8_MACFA
PLPTQLWPPVNARIGKPAPDFKAAAVVDGAFKEVKLSDYKGKINTPRKEGGLGPLNITLLADVTRRLSEDYGVLKTDEGTAYRGLIIIDGKGVLRQITVNNLPVGRSVDEALRLVQAFQYTDEHGEVCPAGWKPGSDTIKPNVDDSKEYFSKHN